MGIYSLDRLVSKLTLREIEVNPCKKTLFLDLDLTATNLKTGGIDTLLLTYLALLEEKGKLKTIFCTGRPVVAAFFLARDFRLKPPVIGSNGTAIFYKARSESGEGYTVTERINSKSILNEVLEILATKYNRRYRKIFTHAESTDIMLLESEIGDIVELQSILSKDSDILLATEALGGCQLTDSGTGIVHLHGNNTSKGLAIKAYQEATGLARADTLYAGNGANDLSALPYVGYLIAAEHSVPELLRAADAVATSTISATNENIGNTTIDRIIEYLLKEKVLDSHEVAEYNHEVLKRVLWTSKIGEPRPISASKVEDKNSKVDAEDESEVNSDGS